MGPRFFKRGELTYLPPTPQDRYRFNGATLLQAWRVLLWQLQALRRLASMGPRFFKRGEYIQLVIV